MTTSTPLGLDHVKLEDIEAYKLNYAAHDVGKGLNDVIQYYNKWAQKGTYEQVCKRHVRTTKRIELSFKELYKFKKEYGRQPPCAIDH